MTEKSEQNSAHVEYPRRYQIDGMITTKRQIKFRVSMINTKKKKKGSNIMISKCDQRDSQRGRSDEDQRPWLPRTERVGSEN